MTLRIGGVSNDELLHRLEEGFCVTGWAKDIMLKPAFTTLRESIEIELGWIKVVDLDFAEAPTTPELFARIGEVAKFCPAEVGPHVRVVDKNQPRGTWYWLAMEPIADSNGGPSVFELARYDDGRRWLGALYARPSDRWGLGEVVVLVLRK
ncbi:MAG: hypothetical protein HYW80_00285 [Parcubacteria group bacterium]|nr:hypothetical protein [Parcubacteria group bacterium]